MTILQNRPDTAAAAAPAAPAPAAAPRRSGAFRDAIAAEFMKVRTLRSTWAFLAGGVAVTALGALILLMLVQSYDAASAADKQNYETADPTVVTMPFVMFFVGAIGAMLITSEYTTRSIGPARLAVPQKRILIGAKATVAALIGLVAGGLFAGLAFLDAKLMLGDRPQPINPWPQWTDAMPTLLSATLIVTVTTLIAMGLGTLLRSTAAALTTLGALVLVAPVFAHFLPDVWQLRLASILLPNLTHQLAGSNHPYLLSQAGAAAVTAGLRPARRRRRRARLPPPRHHLTAPDLPAIQPPLWIPPQRGRLEGGTYVDTFGPCGLSAPWGPIGAYRLLKRKETSTWPPQ